MDGLADAIARLHAIAEPRTDRGGRDGMAWVVDGNALGFAEHGAGVLDRESADRLHAAARAALDRHAQLLEARRRQGLVRSCHGDLHLRNICLLDGVPTLFDGVEFNERDLVRRRALRSRVSSDGPVAPRSAGARQRGLQQLP